PASARHFVGRHPVDPNADGDRGRSRNVLGPDPDPIAQYDSFDVPANSRSERRIFRSGDQDTTLNAGCFFLGISVGDGHTRPTAKEARKIAPTGSSPPNLYAPTAPRPIAAIHPHEEQFGLPPS